MKNSKEFLISPDLENDNLTKEIEGINEAGESIKLPVVKEIPLTIYLNKQEIVTAMTLGDMPDLLAVGYLLNQNMLKKNDVISEVTYDDDLQVVIVRTKRKTNYEEKMEKKIRTSGCAVGTVYGDIMDDFTSINLDKTTKIKTSWIYSISKKVNTRPSLYLKAGALHGCVLCRNDTPLVYVEDVADLVEMSISQIPSGASTININGITADVSYFIKLIKKNIPLSDIGIKGNPLRVVDEIRGNEPSKIFKKFKYTSLKDGIKRTIDFY